MCRSLFLLACVLPTLVLGSWALWRGHPSFQLRQLAWLEDALGASIACQQIQTPRPGQVVFQQLQLRDRETREPLATIDRLQIVAQDDRREMTAGVLILSADSLPRLAESMKLSLRKAIAGRQTLTIQQVQLAAQTWDHVQLSLGVNQGEERELELRHLSPGGLAVRLARNRAVQPPLTRFTLQTGEAPLAWKLLAGLTPMPADLGPQASLTGELSLVCETSEGELAGQLQGVNLSQLAPREAELKLVGPATLSQARLAWRGQRFQDIDLQVEAPGGVVQWWLPDAARYYLGCGAVGTLYDALEQARATGGYQSEPLAFDRLAFRLQVDPAGVRISGIGRQQQGLAAALLWRDREQLLFEPRLGPAAPVEALLQLAKSPRARAPEFCPHARALSERLPFSSTGALRR